MNNREKGSAFSLYFSGKRHTVKKHVSAIGKTKRERVNSAQNGVTVLPWMVRNFLTEVASKDLKGKAVSDEDM